MESPITQPSTLVDSVPREVDYVLERALARDVNERYQTALDFHDALESALAPASPRDVRAYLERQCAERLAERRGALQAMMEGRLAPLSMRPSRPVDDASNSLRLRGVVPPPPSTPALGGGSSDQSGSKGTQITHDAPIVQPSANRGRLAVFLGLALVGVTATAILVSRGESTPSQVVSATPGSNSAPPAAQPDDSVELALIADLPIESVRARGARHADISGSRARLRVDRWTGSLTIDAVLVGGKQAHATALEGTFGELRLITEVPDAGATPRAPTHPHEPPPAAPAGNELHPNPYGP
jgi:hypothetical protein